MNPVIGPKSIYFIPFWLDEFMKAVGTAPDGRKLTYKNVMEQLAEEDILRLKRANVLFMEALFPEVKTLISKKDPRSVLENPWAIYDEDSLKLEPGQCVISPLYAPQEELQWTDVYNRIHMSLVTIDDTEQEGAIVVIAQKVSNLDKLVANHSLSRDILCALSSVAGIPTAIESKLLETYLRA